MLLKELAIKAGNLTVNADKLSVMLKPYIKSSTYVGDIEEYKVLLNNQYYFLVDNNDLIAYLTFKKVDDYYKVDDLWVKDTFRGKRILSKLLWFLKSRENFNKIFIGVIHSEMTYDIIKNNGFSLFSKYWYNPVTKKKIEYDKNNVDAFYKDSKCSLMLECLDFNDMPRFNGIEAGYISQSYDWQIQ